MGSLNSNQFRQWNSQVLSSEKVKFWKNKLMKSKFIFMYSEWASESVELIVD